MEKRRFEHASSVDEEEDGEFRPGAVSEEEDPKRARGGELEDEEEESTVRAQEGDDFRKSSPRGGGEQDVDSVEANEKDEKRDGPRERVSNTSSTRESAEPEIAETRKSRPIEASEIHAALQKLGALTGDAHRVKWVEKLVQEFQLVDNLEQKIPFGNEKKGRERFSLQDAALSATVDLEKAVHEALGADFRKYDQKMRQLNFNFKHNPCLARRFLRGEFEHAVIIHMTPEELKEGSALHEKREKEPEQSQYIQMADARCSRCSETRVGVVEIIHAGGHGDRYQLECASCGHTWSASIDDVSSLTIDTSSVVKNVGAAPWATAKFEDVERELMSPHEGGKSAIDLLQRATEPYIPVLETKRSLDEWSPEDVPPSAKVAE